MRRVKAGVPGTRQYREGISHLMTDENTFYLLCYYSQYLRHSLRWGHRPVCRGTPVTVPAPQWLLHYPTARGSCAEQCHQLRTSLPRPAACNTDKQINLLLLCKHDEEKESYLSLTIKQHAEDKCKTCPQLTSRWLGRDSWVTEALLAQVRMAAPAAQHATAQGGWNEWG